MRTRSLVLVGLLAVVALIMFVTPAAAGTHPIWVNVAVDPSHGNEYELHIGKSSWLVEQGGAASLETETTVTVQLWRLRDCHLLASFRAAPESLYQVGISNGGQVSVQHLASMDIPTSDVGSPNAAICSLPDTAVASTTPASSSSLTHQALAMLALGMSVLFFASGWRRRRR